MPRIPIIEQQSSVAVSQPSPQAQGSPVVSPIGNAGQIAGQGLEDMALYQQKREADNAIANLPTSDAALHWDQYITDAPKQLVNGGNIQKEDGTQVGFMGKAKEDFDKWGADFLAKTPEGKPKLYATEFLRTLRTQTLEKAINIEARANLDNKVSIADKDTSNWASLAAKTTDIGQIDQIIEQAKLKIANSGFDQTTRNKKALEATQAIVEAAAHGAMERDPIATRAALIARYGVDPVAAKAAAPGAKPAAAAPGFDGVMGFIFAKEGGYVANDAGKGPTNFGINKTANPDVDVANLTKDQAAGIYKKRYWDAIGGDTLDPAMQTVAMNAAVNMGVVQAKEMLKMAGGNPEVFTDLAKTRYQAIAKSNPDKAQYLNGWIARANDALAAAPAPGYVPAGSPAGTTAPAAPAAPAYSPALASLIDKLPIERVPSYISAATTQVNQQQATVRSQVQTTEGDHITAFMQGQSVQKPLTVDDYTRAFGPADGAARYANYQSIQQLGQDITSMKAMPPTQMANLAASYKPDPDKPGYELATKRYEMVLNAADQVNKARQADPMLYAMQNGIGGAKPLNFQDPKSFATELSRRQGVASTMQSTYGAPMSLLTSDEVKTLHQGFDTMTTQQRLGYLGTIKASVSDPVAYRSIMQQIAPDSPVTAMAGIILSKQDPLINKNWLSPDDVYQPKDVAGTIIEGEALINPSKSAKGEDGKGKVFPMPKEQDMRDAFTNAVGKAFAADPRGADFAYQATKAYYAGKSSKTGDVSGTIDSGRMKEAITAVIGGVTNVNGNGEVIRPWGMNESSFKDKAKAAFDGAMKAGNMVGSPVDNYGAYGLQSAGDGKYMLKSGTGYLTDKTGAPIVLDLTQPTNYAYQIPTGQQTDGGRGWSGSIVQPPSAKPVTEHPKTK